MRFPKNALTNSYGKVTITETDVVVYFFEGRQKVRLMSHI
jgi:hypothetical protein